MMARGNTRSGRSIAIVWLVLVAGVVIWLVVRAFADAWRAPAMLPQAYGLHGWNVALRNSLQHAFVQSLLIATIAALVGGVLATSAMTVAVRAGRRARRLALVLLVVPALLPGTVVAIGMATFATRIGLQGSISTVVAVHLPFVMAWQTIVLLGTWDRTLCEREDVAATLGVGPVMRLMRVTIPGVRLQLVAVLALGFLVSWGQYTTTLLVATGADTLPLRLVPMVQSQPAAAAVMTIAMLVPALLVTLALRAPTRRPS